MHRIFPNLYRFDFGPRGADRQMSHTYLLVRKAGNLLICHANRGSSVMDHADEIEKLGGIHMQFIPHFHDANRGELHQALYDRFGCEISYHEGDLRSMRTKTRCPEQVFDNEGLSLGTDFQAFYFPGHTPGMSVYTWKNRGKQFLFPSHVVGRREGEWSLNVSPHLAPKQKSRFSELAKMDFDYWVRGGSAEGTNEVYALNTKEKQAFRKALRAKLAPRKASGKPRILTGYVPCLDMLRETKQFEFEEVPGYNTCKIDTIETHMGTADVILFKHTPRTFASGNPFLSTLRDFAEKGGGVLVGDSRPRIKKNWIISTHPFPEIVTGVAPASGFVKGGQHTITVVANHPALGGVKKGARYTSEAEVGIALEPGEKGTVLLENDHGEPVCVAGETGKGRVVVLGLFHKNKMVFAEEEKTLLPAILNWLAGKR